MCRSTLPFTCSHGQLMYNFFSEATQTAMSSVLGAAPLIKKVYIPKYIFPLEKVANRYTYRIFSLIALILVMIYTHTQVHLTVLLFWVPMVILFIFNFGVGLILAAGTVFFRISCICMASGYCADVSDPHYVRCQHPARLGPCSHPV